MKVKDLIAALQAEDPEADIYIATSGGIAGDEHAVGEIITRDEWLELPWDGGVRHPDRPTDVLLYQGQHVRVAEDYRQLKSWRECSEDEKTALRKKWGGDNFD
ncbi:MAG: hypothetical protein H6718_04240 [Polyangiaceae bacterium]|nr:hypothetical protein [Polyangiaceae bacterium]